MNQLPEKVPFFQTDFAISEFAERRQRVAECIGAGAVAVLRGAPSSGAFEVFRQFNDFYYLSGIEVPHSYLLIEGGTGRSTIYLPHRDEKLERSDGPQLNCDVPEVARQLTGIEQVGPQSQLAADLASPKRIFVPLAGSEGRQMCRDTIRHAKKEQAADRWSDTETADERFARRLSASCPGAPMDDLSPILDRLRLVKSSSEITLMRRAGSLTAQAVVEAMKTGRAGHTEYQLAAIADHVFRYGGAHGAGYAAIIACGANIWNAHYSRLNCELVDGELVLMDYAPDVGYYTSDIGRIWPVNGQYAPWQRELYGYIVEYHKTLLREIRPGRTAAEIMDTAAQQMAPVVQQTAWSRPGFRAAAEATLKFRGHLSHPVGMSVHDVGDYRSEPLRPGIVFALDPQMWVPDDEIYIRVEDTVVVTPTGVEVVTAEAPLELDDTEALLGRQ